MLFTPTIVTAGARRNSLNCDFLPRINLSSEDEQFSKEEIKFMLFSLQPGKAHDPSGTQQISSKDVRAWSSTTSQRL